MRAIAIVDISEPSVQMEFTALANLCGVGIVVAPFRHRAACELSYDIM